MRRSDVTSLRARLLLAAGAVTAVSLYGGARRPAVSSAHAETPPETVCIPPEADGQCPSDQDALEQVEDPDRCAPILDEPGATQLDGECCYQVRYDCGYEVVGCSIGRPLIVEGRPLAVPSRPSTDWHDPRLAAPDLAGLSARERSLLALHWARIGAAEYTSIAGLQRFAMSLMACGAPPDLVTRAHRAALDEVRHARLAFTLASAFAGAPIGPGALDLPAAVPVHRSLTELAVATAEEGCTVETLSACLLAEALHHAADPTVTAALAGMRRDEDRHAALAWAALRWALSRDPSSAAPALAALDAATARLSTDGFAHPAGLERFGLLRPSQAEACRRTAVRVLIEPCRDALLAHVRGSQAQAWRSSTSSST